MQILKAGISNNRESGFSLVEVIVVLAIISVMSILVMPRMSAYFSSKRKNTALITGYFTRVFDNAFINKHNNYLVIHLNNQSDKIYDNSDFDKTNSLSVFNLEGTSFKLSDSKYLQPITFSNNFVLESVLFPDGEEINEGNIFIPFHKAGYSKNFILYIRLSNSNYMSIYISKMQKEPYVFSGRKNFEDVWEK